MIEYYWSNQTPGNKIIKLMDQEEIAELGASLRPIDQRLLTPAKEKNKTRVWYQGGEPYFDMFIELEDGKIKWCQFTLRGKSISWNSPTSGWQTGITNELQADDVTFYPASKFIESDRQLDQEFVELAHSILQTRASEEIFDKILALFENPD